MCCRWIQLEGHLDSEVKLNKEGKYVVIVKSSLEDKENSESILFVEMTKKQWDRVKNKEGKLYITGKMMVKKNKKDIPFVYVISMNVSETKEIKNKLKSKKKDENIETPVSCVEEKKEDDAIEKSDLKKEVKINKQIISWFRYIPKESFIEVEAKKIRIMQECHNNFKLSIDITEKNKNYSGNPIAVSDLGNGEYELLVGIKSYVKAKLFDKKLKVFVTDLTREEFEKEYNIVKKK